MTGNVTSVTLDSIMNFFHFLSRLRARRVLCNPDVCRGAFPPRPRLVFARLLFLGGTLRRWF